MPMMIAYIKEENCINKKWINFVLVINPTTTPAPIIEITGILNVDKA